jgi:hypothetical protein
VSSPARIAPLVMDAASPSAARRAFVHPDNSEPGSNLREQIARVATWMHTTLDAVAATLPQTLRESRSARTRAPLASGSLVGR